MNANNGIKRQMDHKKAIRIVSHLHDFGQLRRVEPLRNDLVVVFAPQDFQHQRRLAARLASKSRQQTRQKRRKLEFQDPHFKKNKHTVWRKSRVK